MIRFIYNLCWPIGLIFFLPRYLVKMFRRGGYRKKFGQRFAWYDVDLRRRLTNRNPIWLHAVSVGEVAVALKLASKLRALRPGQHFVLTTTTTTGFAFANENTADWIEVMYSPLDFWPVMRRAFAVIRPDKIALIEAEVWPNLMAEAHSRRIPIALVNARLSPRSEKRFRRFRLFVRPMFRNLDIICVQNSTDVARWESLGVARARIHYTGSIKYDPEDAGVDPTAAMTFLAQLKIDNRRPILLGGSTHPGEEDALAAIFREIRSEFPDLFLILAPRHVERAVEIQSKLEQLGVTVALRSQSQTAGRCDCLLIDSTGELRNWYPVATVIFIGKSLSALGGQNPAEAIVADKPVIFGAHMENFAVLANELVAKHGARRVKSIADLSGAIVDLLRDGDLREAMVRNARDVLAEHHGAAARTAKLIVGL